MKERNTDIDMLRGLSMFVMILIHTNAYHLGNKLAYILWDVSQFAVPVFLFCAAYIFFRKPFVFTPQTYTAYIWKRVTRLLIPYYLFLPIWLLIIYLHKPSDVTHAYIEQSLLLSGGFDASWLVLLFIYLTLLMPVISFVYQSKPALLWLYALLCAGVAFFFLDNKLPFPFRQTMWLTWPLIVLFSLYVVHFESRKWFFVRTILLTGALFFLVHAYQYANGHSLAQFHNKYPPNLYHLSYGFMTITGLYALARLKAFNLSGIRNLFSFLSTNSYPIFFIHFFILIAIRFWGGSLKLGWVEFFLVTLVSTLVVQWTLNRILYFFSMLKKANPS